jgi:hypothetical protein
MSWRDADCEAKAKPLAVLKVGLERTELSSEPNGGSCRQMVGGHQGDRVRR